MLHGDHVTSSKNFIQNITGLRKIRWYINLHDYTAHVQQIEVHHI